LKSAVLSVYEQDWLDTIFFDSPEFLSTLTVGVAFADEMSRSMNERGIRMQYCAPTPHYFLQGTYVFCFPRSAQQSVLCFRPLDFGFQSDVWVYHPASQEGTLLHQGDTFRTKFSSPLDQSYAYYLVAPVLRDGICLIGDIDKIASVSRKRITSVNAGDKGISIVVSYAAGEGAVVLGVLPRGHRQSLPVLEMRALVPLTRTVIAT
jgi:hypothetical protein